MIGQTAEIEARKGVRSSGARRQWDEQTVFADLLQRRGREETRVAQELYDWTLARGWRPTFGMGKQDGSWIPVVSLDPDAITRRPSIQLSLLTPDPALEQLKQVLEWVQAQAGVEA